MQDLLLIATAIIFYLLGRFSTYSNEQVVKQISSIKQKIEAIDIPSVIRYRTPSEKIYEDSGQAEDDRLIAELIDENLRKAGLESEIK